MTSTTKKCIIVIPWAVRAVTIGDSVTVVTYVTKKGVQQIFISKKKLQFFVKKIHILQKKKKKKSFFSEKLKI